VHDLWIDDTILKSQVIEEIKHVFDGGGQWTSSVNCAEYRLKQAVDVLLQGGLQNKQNRTQTAVSKR